MGCQLWLHLKGGKIVKVTGVEGAAPNQGRLCVKGRFGYDFIYSPERLTMPLIKTNGEFREASWDEALDLVAHKLKETIEKHGPDAIAGRQLRPQYQRRFLSDAKTFPRRDRDEQHRSLRPYLTRPHRRRTGDFLRFRGDDQFLRRFC